MSNDVVRNRLSEGSMISRGCLLKQGATAAAAVMGAGALATTLNGGPAEAARVREAPFNVTGLAQVTLTLGVNTDFPLKDMQPAISQFEAQNPSIKVKVAVNAGTTWAQIFENYLTRIAAGNPPDVAQIATEGVALMGGKELALPLDTVLKNDVAYNQEFRSDSLPVMFSTLRYKGAQIALPMLWNNMMFWYNTRLFTQLGLPRPDATWTASDLLDLCAKVGKKAQYSIDVPNGGSIFTLECWSLAAGAKLISDDLTKSNALAPGNLTAWQLIHDLVFKYKYAPRPATNFPESSLFEAGRLGMLTAGRWPIIQFKADKFSSCDIQYFPKLGSSPQRTIIGIGGVSIFKASKYPEQAWALVKFLTSKVGIATWTKNGNGIPCRKSLAADDSMHFMSPPVHFKAFWESAQQGAAAVSAPLQYTEAATAIQKWFSKMITNQVAPAEALRGLDGDLKGILQKAV